MKTYLYNFQGEKIGEIEFPEIFNLEFNPALVHQVMRWQMLNNYHPYAHTKTRGEVRGGGRKPWPQKGTGRARHGSIRSPIWKGGGVVFGPRKEKIRQIKVNKKMKKKAILMTIAEKLRQNLIRVIDKLEPKEYKTKEFEKFFSKFLQPRKTKKKKETALLVIENDKKEIYRSIRNLPYADAISARNLNLLELLNHKYLFLTKDSLTELYKRFSV
ncbi:MAG: 50S ribosomal protein L4 [Candidatus Parcubacteria bacterium]|nr:MAG: 50S ribosomal protein L4 [Candidatus Parcubacteria bacterium]